MLTECRGLVAAALSLSDEECEQLLDNDNIALFVDNVSAAMRVPAVHSSRDVRKGSRGSAKMTK